MKWLIILLLLSAFAAAECIKPTDGMNIKEDILMCSSTYDLPSGIVVSANDITVDCGTAVLRGTPDKSSIGIKVADVTNVTIKNCNVLTFDQGLFLKNVTHSLIEDNAFLKNRIGVRMLDSFENVIRDNNDKSFQLAVSAINSKYNVVIIGNKDIERAFCEVNACNEFRDMNPCESGDFYCSKRCSADTDSDCAAPVPAVQENKSVEPPIIEEERKEVEQKVEKTEPPQRKISTWMKIFIYILLYLITFIVLRKKR